MDPWLIAGIFFIVALVVLMVVLLLPEKKAPPAKKVPIKPKPQAKPKPVPAPVKPAAAAKQTPPVALPKTPGNKKRKMMQRWVGDNPAIASRIIRGWLRQGRRR